MLNIGLNEKERTYPASPIIINDQSAKSVSTVNQKGTFSVSKSASAPDITMQELFGNSGIIIGYNQTGKLTY